MPMEVGRRERLRAATAAAHAALDASVSGLELERVDDYRRFLRGNAAALLAAEALLEQAAVAQRFADWPQRSRRAFIVADLEGVDARVDPLTWVRAIPKHAEMFGMIYVLEGSRLGARSLLPRVQASAEPRVSANCRFLSAQQPHLWRVFLEQLESETTADDEPAVIAAALDTFALFQRSFSLVHF